MKNGYATLQNASFRNNFLCPNRPPGQNSEVKVIFPLAGRPFPQIHFISNRAD
jgi:hypothetical protein